MARSRPILMSNKRGAVYAQRAYRANKSITLKVAPRRYGRSLNYRTGGFLGIEKKFLDTGIATTNLVVSAACQSCEFDPTTALCLNAPVVSDGQSGREGRQITMDSIEIKGSVYIPPTANQNQVVAAPIVTVFLVLDKQTNGAQLNSEDVFVSPYSAQANASMPSRNLEYEKRFSVLASRRINPIAMPLSFNVDTDVVYSSGIFHPFTLRKNLKGMKVNFKQTGTDGTVATITDNSLHIIATCTGIGAEPQMFYNSRLRFRG